MKKMLVLASVIALAACEKKAEEAPMADTTAAVAPAPATDTAAMTTDTTVKADSAAAAPADTMARDTAASH